MRDFSHQCLLGYFLGVLTITFSHDATRDINAKYVKRRGLRKDMPFEGRNSKF